jgi:hypothetical protein
MVQRLQRPRLSPQAALSNSSWDTKCVGCAGQHWPAIAANALLNSSECSQRVDHNLSDCSWLGVQSSQMKSLDQYTAGSRAGDRPAGLTARVRETGCRLRKGVRAKPLSIRHFAGRRVRESGCRLSAGEWVSLDTGQPISTDPFANSPTSPRRSLPSASGHRHWP